jgi:hypothetical protein
VVRMFAKDAFPQCLSQILEYRKTIQRIARSHRPMGLRHRSIVIRDYALYTAGIFVSHSFSVLFAFCNGKVLVHPISTKTFHVEILTIIDNMTYDSIAAALHNTSSSWYGHVIGLHEPFPPFCFDAKGERSMANSRCLFFSSALEIGV